MKPSQSAEDQAAESLSSLADGEVASSELDRWVHRLASDEAARARFARYRLIGAQMGSEEILAVNASCVAERVREALRDEPTLLAPRQRPAFSLPRVALGAAVAAGVALLAVGLAPSIIGLSEPQMPEESPSFAFAPRLSVPAEGITLVAVGSEVGHSKPGAAEAAQRWKVLSPEMRAKISRYLVEHNELAGHIAAQSPSSHLGYVSTHEPGQ